MEEGGLPFCRICLDIDETKNLISPCLCSGTSKWVHKECLNHWRSSFTENHDNNIHCRECKGEYNYAYKPITVEKKRDPTNCVVYLCTVVNCVAIGYSMVCSTRTMNHTKFENGEFSQCSVDLLPVLSLSTCILIGVVCKIYQTIYDKITYAVFTTILTFTLTFLSLLVDPSSTAISLIIVGQGYFSVLKMKQYSQHINDTVEWRELRDEE